MQFKRRTIDALARMICGDVKQPEPYFVYRSSSYLTRFFQDSDTDFEHDGSTRAAWVASALQQVLLEAHPNPQTPPESFARVIKTLMDRADALNDLEGRPKALGLLNTELSREGFEAFYAVDGQCYIRHIATQTVASATANPHRPFTPAELKKREQLAVYLERASEDQLIEEVLLPLFRQLGFQRVTAAGHKDKALEYGKDVWMRFTLPTQHSLYFGIQAKKGKIDAAGSTREGNANVAEIYNQASMMLGHEVFDPEPGRRVLVDHAFIVSGGEITKSARNWIGNKFDVAKRSQLMFMDREDILNLYVASNAPLPVDASD